MKTTYAYVEEPMANEARNRQPIRLGHGTWKLLEDQAGLDHDIVNIADRPRRLAVIIHPRNNSPKGLAEPAGENAANMAVDTDFDWEEQQECFYCGEDICSSPSRPAGKAYAPHAPPTSDANVCLLQMNTQQ